MKQIFLTLVLITTLFSCDFIEGQKIRGDGNITTQVRSVSDFKGIDVSGATEVYVTQDPGYMVKVETDNNLQEFVITEKNGDILEIHQKNGTNLHPSEKVKVYVSAPMFKMLHISGASDLFSKNKLSSEETLDIEVSGASGATLEIKAPSVDIDASGASSIKIAGQTKDLKVTGNGASRLYAFDLLSENADVDISGASKAEVTGSVKIKAVGSGASEILYKGSGTATTDVSGASTVKKAE